MNSFKIFIDSNCDLPPEYIVEHDIEIIPIPFDLDGVAHDTGDWQKISGKEYYDALRSGSIARTSQINIESFVRVFTEYAKQGIDLLFLILSGKLSNTYQNSMIALKEVKEVYPDCNIYPIDSINATTGHGLLTMLVVKKREEGLSVQETAAWLEKKKHSCLGFFTVDDLMYLHRGGRLSKFSAIAGSVLGFKPVLNFAPDGSLCLKDKVRGREAAMKLMISQSKRCIDPATTLDTVLITHTDCADDAEIFAEMIKSAIDVRQVIIMMMGPVIGAHLGPGAVTIVFEADMTREEYESKYYKETD